MSGEARIRLHIDLPDSRTVGFTHELTGAMAGCTRPLPDGVGKSPHATFAALQQLAERERFAKGLALMLTAAVMDSISLQDGPGAHDEIYEARTKLALDGRP